MADAHSAARRRTWCARSAPSSASTSPSATSVPCESRASASRLPRRRSPPRLDRVSARLSGGALVWAGFDGPAVPGPLLDGIARGRIGGLLLFAYRGNIRSREQVRGMLREAVAAARRGGLAAGPVGGGHGGGRG